MRHSIARAVLLGAAFLALGVYAWADTLVMRDGRQIEGTFLGGSADQIQFQVNGKFQVFAKRDVGSIHFSAAVAPSTPVAPATPASSPSSQQVTVPAGSTMLVRMIDSVDSSTNHVGDTFHASLEENLYAGDVLVAPKGADVYGRLAEAQSAGKIAGKSDLRLELTGISINGKLQPIVTGEYEVQGKSRGKQSAERIGGGAALGAIIGAIAGGGKGAAIGAGVGAGAGTAVQVITHGEQVKVPSETLLSFRLQAPLTVQAPSSH
jgi:hypothetical protein